MTDVIELPETRAVEAAAVLAEAFHDYPVMRFVIGQAGDDYDRRLAALVGFFTMARFHRREPALAVLDGGTVAAVALVKPPGTRPMPAVLADERDAVWRELGPDAQARYEAFSRAGDQVGIDRPNCHLSMIGARRSHAGRGCGRKLLDAVHALSQRDPASSGVTLTTENPANLSLYEHFGYNVVGHLRVSPDLETWGFYRPDDPA